MIMNDWEFLSAATFCWTLPRIAQYCHICWGLLCCWALPLCWVLLSILFIVAASCKFFISQVWILPTCDILKGSKGFDTTLMIMIMADFPKSYVMRVKFITAFMGSFAANVTFQWWQIWLDWKDLKKSTSFSPIKIDNRFSLPFCECTKSVRQMAAATKRVKNKLGPFACMVSESLNKMKATTTKRKKESSWLRRSTRTRTTTRDERNSAAHSDFYDQKAYLASISSYLIERN